MAPKCKPDVAAARAQTASMIAEAEKKIHEGTPQLSGAKKKTKGYALIAPGARTAAHCSSRLESARAAFTAANEAPTPLEQRNGYIRAAFQAGQALSCAQTAKIGTKMGVAPLVKAKKPKEPKAPKAKKSKKGEE